MYFWTFSKSGTPLNTPIGPWNLCLFNSHFFGYFGILKIFENNFFWWIFFLWRQNIIDVNLKSDVTIFKNWSKLPNFAFFGKKCRKRTRKMGSNFKNGLSVQKLWQNENFGWLTSIFGGNFTQNLRNNAFSRVKRLSYHLELFFWHILATFKNNSRNGFSAKSQKLPKMAKNGIN